MPVNINASNSAGIQITADTSGVIQFQSNGANTAQIAANGVVTSAGLTSTGRVTAANVTLSSGGILTFADLTTQSTAAVSGGMTLLGTLATTSGNSVSLTGLNLTIYRQINFVWQGVRGGNGSFGWLLNLGTNINDLIGITSGSLDGSVPIRGICLLDLTQGTFTNTYAATANDASAVAVSYGGDLPITTASTSILLFCSGNNFFAGSISVYGVR